MAALWKALFEWRLNVDVLKHLLFENRRFYKSSSWLPSEIQALLAIATNFKVILSLMAKYSSCISAYWYFLVSIDIHFFFFYMQTSHGRWDVPKWYGITEPRITKEHTHRTMTDTYLKLKLHFSSLFTEQARCAQKPSERIHAEGQFLSSDKKEKRKKKRSPCHTCQSSQRDPC